MHTISNLNVQTTDLVSYIHPQRLLLLPSRAYFIFSVDAQHKTSQMHACLDNKLLLPVDVSAKCENKLVVTETRCCCSQPRQITRLSINTPTISCKICSDILLLVYSILALSTCLLSILGPKLQDFSDIKYHLRRVCINSRVLNVPLIRNRITIVKISWVLPLWFDKKKFQVFFFILDTNNDTVEGRIVSLI